MAKAAAKSKALARRAENLPVSQDWMDEMQREAQDSQARIPINASRAISIRGGRFTLQNQVLEPPLNVYILDFALERAYYDPALPFDPDKPASPICWALSYGDAGGEAAMVPSDASADKQADACATCPQNAWGSGTVGRSKACKLHMRTKLLEADNDDPEDAEPAFMKVPPASLDGFVKFVRGVAAASGNKMAFFGVECAINFDQNTQYPKLSFKPGEPVQDNKLAQKILSERRGARDELMVPFPVISDEDRARGNGKKAAAPARSAAASAAAPVKKKSKFSR